MQGEEKGGRSRGAGAGAGLEGEGREETSSGPLTLMKEREHCEATALATSVLPVPGGPYSSTPDLLFSPRGISAGIQQEVRANYPT
eukprot:768693-Hanusia_phi.AAC.10